MMRGKKIYRGLCVILCLSAVQLSAMEMGEKERGIMVAMQEADGYKKYMCTFGAALRLEEGLQPFFVDMFVTEPSRVADIAVVCKVCDEYVQWLKKKELINPPQSMYRANPYTVDDYDDYTDGVPTYFSYSTKDQWNIAESGWTFIKKSCDTSPGRRPRAQLPSKLLLDELLSKYGHLGEDFLMGLSVYEREEICIYGFEGWQERMCFDFKQENKAADQ
jgi:hypothetical protein